MFDMVALYTRSERWRNISGKQAAVFSRARGPAQAVAAKPNAQARPRPEKVSEKLLDNFSAPAQTDLKLGGR